MAGGGYGTTGAAQQLRVTSVRQIAGSCTGGGR